MPVPAHLIEGDYDKLFPDALDEFPVCSNEEHYIDSWIINSAFNSLLTIEQYLLDNPPCASGAVGDDIIGDDGQLEIPIPPGCYPSYKSALAWDSNLLAENIKKGIVIFDVEGSMITGDFSFWGINNLRLIHSKPTDHTRIIINPDSLDIPLLIDDTWFILPPAFEVDAVDDLDTGTLAAGTDYYVYACTDGLTLIFKVSANSTVPTGFDAAHSRKIGGFHTLCVAVGTISGHDLSTYAQKDILPASVWCLKHRAKNLVNVGMVYDSKIQKWVDIYLASGTGAATTSVNNGTISDTRDWNRFVDDGLAVGKRLATDTEFQSFATGSNEETNITGSADPGTTTGHSDTAGRRMISNIGCEDCCGAMYQWLQDQSYYPGTPGWVDLPGSKGSLYTGGDVKLVAGGDWHDAAYCGSRCRTANNVRWNTSTAIGARFVSEPL